MSTTIETLEKARGEAHDMGQYGIAIALEVAIQEIKELENDKTRIDWLLTFWGIRVKGVALTNRDKIDAAMLAERSKQP